MSAARNSLLAAAAAAMLLSACGERVQTLPSSSERKADTNPWQNQDTRFLAPGWKAGDESSWNAQLAHRVQGQNDYAPRL